MEKYVIQSILLHLTIDAYFYSVLYAYTVGTKMLSLISKQTNIKTRCENSAPIQAKRKQEILK
jgi:hypothetical protein